MRPYARALLLGCALAAPASGALEGDVAALELDGECVPGHADCTLNALQLRARSVTSAAANEALDVCDDTHPITKQFKSVAPACLQACPNLCAVAQVAVLLPISELCSYQEDLSCAFQPSNVEVCRPALAAAQAAGIPVPATSEALQTSCAKAAALMSVEERLVARAARGKTLAARSAESLERVYGDKVDDPRCVNAGEGRRCGSPTTRIYCTGKKRYKAEVTCESVIGPKSRCVDNDCDDPFCRNGGAFNGDGYYCHNQKVVACSGDNEPEVVDACDTVRNYDFWGCQVTESRKCKAFPQPHCETTSTSRECTTTTRPHPS